MDIAANDQRFENSRGKRGCLKSPRSGFSILELILALGIMAVMAGSVLMVYTNAVRIDSRSRELSEAIFRSYMIFKTIEDDISRSVAYRFLAPDGNGDVPAFVGEKDRLAFVKDTPKGLRWIDFSFEDPEQGTVRTTVMGRRYSKNQDQLLEETIVDRTARSLTRQEFLLNKRSPDETDKELKEIVVSGLYPEDLTFQYGRYEKNTGLIWANSWNDLNLPSAIRVDVRLSKDLSVPGAVYSKVIVLPAGF